MANNYFQIFQKDEQSKKNIEQFANDKLNSIPFQRLGFKFVDRILVYDSLSHFKIIKINFIDANNRMSSYTYKINQLPKKYLTEFIQKVISWGY